MKDKHGKSTIVGLHRFILGADGFLDYVDHRNGNPMDCTRKNLRKATPTENARNRTRVYKSGKRAGNSLGVCHVPELNRTNPWIAYLSVEGKRKWLGYYATEEEASSIRKEAAKKYHGAFASRL
jgi:hypothetical protein